MRRPPSPIGPELRLQLAHYDHATTRYTLQPITTPRPERGALTVTQRCDVCGADTRIKVFSVRRVRARRGLRAIVAALGATVGVALAATSIWLFSTGERPASVLPLSVLPLLAVGVVLATLRSRREDGTKALDKDHTVREPGDVYDPVQDSAGIDAG